MRADLGLRRPSIGRRATIGLLSLAFASICFYPYISRLTHPSLYSDDILRIADLKTIPLSRLLVRPFNEHLAPLFEVVSWISWNLSGRSLSAARWTFSLASYLPFLLCLGAFYSLIRREFGSTAAALVGVAIFSLSTLPAEVVFWYSASSFSWALLLTIVALDFSVRAIRESDPRSRNFLLASISSFLAPMGSGLGLLAGPLATSRMIGAGSRNGEKIRLLGKMMPLLGTFAYLGFGWMFHYESTLSESLGENADVPRGLWQAFRAPTMVLIPGLFGFSNVETHFSTTVQAISCLVFWGGALVWSTRSRYRPTSLVGLGLIFGGYALTYPLRVRKQSLDLLEYQRYHDFPLFGFVLLVICAILPLLKRFDPFPIRRLALALAVAAASLAAHLGEFRSRANLYRFPEQASTFLAVEHLEGICRRESISREQVLNTLEPIRRKWFPHDFNGLRLLGPTVSSPRCPDRAVRPTLLEAMSTGEREALFGSMDVSSYIHPAETPAESIAEGKMTAARSIRVGDPAIPFQTPGWPSYLEFDFPGGSDLAPVRALVFPGCKLNGPVEVWWSDDRSPWSECRSLRWRPTGTGPPLDWTLPVEAIPHLDPVRVRRLRVYFREAGTVALGAPRLVR